MSVSVYASEVTAEAHTPNVNLAHTAGMIPNLDDPRFGPANELLCIVGKKEDVNGGGIRVL